MICKSQFVMILTDSHELTMSSNDSNAFHIIRVHFSLFDWVTHHSSVFLVIQNCIQHQRERKIDAKSIKGNQRQLYTSKTW